MLATIFTNPILVPGWLTLWLLIPLIVVVAVVYKTIRTENVKKLPVEIIKLTIYMLGGLALLGFAVWLIVKIFQ